MRLTPVAHSPDVLPRASRYRLRTRASGAHSGDLEEVAERPHTHGQPPGTGRGCHQTGNSVRGEERGRSDRSRVTSPRFCERSYREPNRAEPPVPASTVGFGNRRRLTRFHNSPTKRDVRPRSWTSSRPLTSLRVPSDKKVPSEFSQLVLGRNSVKFRPAADDLLRLNKTPVTGQTVPSSAGRSSRRRLEVLPPAGREGGGRNSIFIYFILL